MANTDGVGTGAIVKGGVKITDAKKIKKMKGLMVMRSLMKMTESGRNNLIGGGERR